MKKRSGLFSKNLKIIMADEGMSPEDLANAIDVTMQNVHNWLNDRNSPRPETLKSIADYFGFAPSDLINEDLSEIRKKERSASELPANEITHIEVDVGDTLRLIKARTAVILSALSELLSEKSKRLSASELSDLENLVNIQLDKDRKEQQGA